MNGNNIYVDADVIIIGSGIAGLYSAYTIKKLSPNTSVLILEKQPKSLIGGRTGNDTFYGSNIVTGAGIGRKRKDKLLYKLLEDFEFNIQEYYSNPQKSKVMDSVDIRPIMNKLRSVYTSYPKKNVTFKEFASDILGEKDYDRFVVSSGYTDYEKEDAYETLYHYGMEDNTCCWKAFIVKWRELVMKLYHFIGEKHFKFSKNVKQIQPIYSYDKKQDCSMLHYMVHTDDDMKYTCNKLIVATTIKSIRSLLPHKPIYNDIEGQPFLRLYAKFSKSSVDILQNYIHTFTAVPGPLQKIIPMDVKNGVYMIAYNDNKNSLKLKNYLENTKENKALYERLVEKSLGIPEGSLKIIGIKSYYWYIGTHYYKPLNRNLYSSREDFINKAQHPEKGILVVGEVISTNQGWVEGALESVKQVVHTKWIKSNDCIKNK